MSDLSDLDLVAQAMASSDKPTNPPRSAKSPQTKQADPSIPEGANDHDYDNGNLDLSSLSSEDLALIQPLLAALSMSDSDALDEDSFADVLKQMNAADEVADDLEGKLDRLIGELGKVEEGILEGMDDKSGKVQTDSPTIEKKHGTQEGSKEKTAPTGVEDK